MSVHSINLSLLTSIVRETEAERGPVSIETAKKLLFTILELREANPSTSFYTALCRAKTVLGLPEADRSRYHSLATKYFKRITAARPKKKPAPAITPTPQGLGLWKQIKILCEKESPAIREAANEHIINADGVDQDWSPDAEECERWD